jgi:hypothetical protein
LLRTLQISLVIRGTTSEVWHTFRRDNEIREKAAD